MAADVIEIKDIYQPRNDTSKTYKREKRVREFEI